jgi:type 1 glutamine amidotransferase
MILEIGKRACVVVITVISIIQASAQQTAPNERPGTAGQDRMRNRAPSPPGQNPSGIRVYIRAGLKSHGLGEHDYPQFLADWSKLLTQHGAKVDGSLHSPTGVELDSVEVVVIYKGDAGYMTEREQADLEAFVRRGGGLVSLHDALCGPDPEYLATLVGGGKKHGETNYTLKADVPYTIVDQQHPIMQGMSDFVLKQDEAFYSMTWAMEPKIHVLATAVIASTPTAIRAGHVGEVVPQIWTYEHTLPGGTAPARAFVWMQGHTYSHFADPAVESMLLRGIAWVAKRPVNELMDYRSPGKGPVLPAGPPGKPQ